MGKRVGIIVAMQKEWDALFADTEFVGCGFATGRTKHNRRMAKYYPIFWDNSLRKSRLV